MLNAARRAFRARRTPTSSAETSGAPACRRHALLRSAARSIVERLERRVLMHSWSGTVWHDFDSDGVQDTDDPREHGLEGWTLELYSAQSGTIDETETSESGDYSFNSSEDGCFQLILYAKPGYKQTFPLDPFTGLPTGYGEWAGGPDNPIDESDLDFGFKAPDPPDKDCGCGSASENPVRYADGVVIEDA